MQATKDFTCSWNGRRFSFKKGETVTAPKTLMDALKHMKLVQTPRKVKKDD